MGNRAVIAIKQKNIEIANTPCIYLHWNGGRDSVEGFLETHHKLGMRGAEDATYALARLTQIIANAIGGELSVGVGIYSQLDTDNYDNGVYWLDNVDGKLQIVEREELNLLEMVFMDSLELNREFKDTTRDIQKLYIKICNESESKIGLLDALLTIAKKRGT